MNSPKKATPKKPTITRQTKADLLAMKLTPRVLRQYRELVAPPGASRYHRRIRGRWLAEKWKNTGTWKKLDDYALRRHLIGKGYFIAVRWGLSGVVRHAVIDIDSPLKKIGLKVRRNQPELVDDADDLMHYHLTLVVRALGDVPHVVVRSSTTRGLHLYLFFDREYPAADVNRAITERLYGAALVPGGAVVDKVFPSSQALRLPLGAGSCILDDEGVAYGDERPRPVNAKEVAWKPLPAVVARFTTKKWTFTPPAGAFFLLRDVMGSLATITRLANERRIPLARLGSPACGVVEKEVEPSTPTPSGSGSTLSGSATFPLASAGSRFKQTRELVFLLHRGGLSKSAAMSEVEEWLRRSAVAGSSKDLSGADARKLQVFVDDAAGFWDWLGAHPLPVATGKKVVALSTTAGLVPRSHRTTSSSTTPRGWDRERARLAVGPADLVRLAQIPCEWLRGKVHLLVGLLRLTERAHGPLDEVTIGAVVFDRIIGGRRPPSAALPVESEAWGGPVPVRTAIRWALADLGYATRLDTGLERQRASLFKVTMPDADSDVASPSHTAADASETPAVDEAAE